MPTLDELKSTLSELPLGDRLILADWVYASADTDDEWLAEWGEVCEARLAEFESGRVKGIPIEETFRRLAENRARRETT